MISTFRQSGLGQVVIGVIVALIIGAFVLTGSISGAASWSKECAIEVGKRCVDPKEYFAAYGLMSSIGLNDKAAKQLQLRAQIAEGLVERELLLEEAEKLGISISTDEIDEELAAGRTRVSLPVAHAERLALSLAMCVEGPAGCAPGTVGLRALPVHKDGVLDYERYKRMVRLATGRSPNHFKEMQKRELTAERLRELIRSGVRVSEEEAYFAFERARSKATVRTVTASARWFAQYVTAPTDAQLDDWALENKDKVDAAVTQEKARWKAECPAVSEIRLELDPTAGDDEKQAQRDAIAAARTRLKRGESFETLAREIGDGPEAAWGGFIGCLSEDYGAGAQALLAAVGQLEPGQVSDVVESVTGLHLLRLEAKPSEEELEPLARRLVVRRMATEELAHNAARRYTEELIQKVQAGENLEEATESLNRNYAESGPVKVTGKDKVHPALESTHRPKVEISRAFTIDQNPLPSARGEKSPASIAFALEKDGDVAAEPLEVFGGFAVLQLKDKDLAQRETFDEEKAELLEQFRARKADEVLASYVARLRKQAGVVRFNPKHVPTEDSAGESPGES